MVRRRTGGREDVSSGPGERWWLLTPGQCCYRHREVGGCGVHFAGLASGLEVRERE